MIEVKEVNSKLDYSIPRDVTRRSVTIRQARRTLELDQNKKNLKQNLDIKMFMDSDRKHKPKVNK